MSYPIKSRSRALLESQVLPKVLCQGAVGLWALPVGRRNTQCEPQVVREEERAGFDLVLNTFHLRNTDVIFVLGFRCSRARRTENSGDEENEEGKQFRVCQLGFAKERYLWGCGDGDFALSEIWRELHTVLLIKPQAEPVTGRQDGAAIGGA